MTPRSAPLKILCECLGVSEAEVVSAIRAEGLETVRQVSRCTAAGSGCTACHPAIREHLERQALRAAAEAAPAPAPSYFPSSPSFSAR